jgi:putative hydrolase of the HAD superfamily
VTYRAVLFDIYGTLLRSAAGEIHPDPAIRALIEKAHAASPHPFPEVDIREIHAAMHPGLPAAEIERLALAHEQAVNPVTAMPGAVETLRELASRGVTLGLVSNAQFYTVPVLEACLGSSLADLGIDPELCVLSYQERRAKPDTHLFEVARGRLIERGVRTEEALYVGNDVRNDIEPAKAAGFRTLLFAGDESSLRLRGRPLTDSGADHVIAELMAIPSLSARW